MSGMRISATTTSTSALIAVNPSSGKYPTHIAIGATGAGAYIKVGNNFGAVATNADLLIQPGDSIVLSVDMMQYVAAMAVSGTSTVSVASLSVGLWDAGLLGQVAAMFASGEQGVWYDPSNMASLFQDSAGTVPVTAVGQPVGRILDQSGRGNHATQATAASRPLLQQDAYGKRNLAFNGTSSFLNIPAIAPADGISAWALAGVPTTGNQVILSPNAPGYLTGFNGFWSWNDGGTIPASSVPVKSRQASSILTDGSFTAIYADSTGSSGAVTRGGTMPAFSFIGSFDGTQAYLTGALYGMVIRASHSTTAQAAQVRAYLAGKLGAVT